MLPRDVVPPTASGTEMNARPSNAVFSSVSLDLRDHVWCDVIAICIHRHNFPALRVEAHDSGVEWLVELALGVSVYLHDDVSNRRVFESRLNPLCHSLVEEVLCVGS